MNCVMTDRKVGYGARRCSARGFTLIELMVVMAIIGVLAVIAIPQFNRYRARAFDAQALQELEQFKTAAANVDAANPPIASRWLPTGVHPDFPEVSISQGVNVWTTSYNLGLGIGGGLIAYSCHTRGVTGYALFSPYTEEQLNWGIPTNLVVESAAYRGIVACP